MNIIARNIWWQFQKLSRRKKIEGNNLVFGEWYGKKCNDNCLFLANYIAKEYPIMNIYWIAKKNTDLSALDKLITRVEMDSPEAKSILKKADVVIVNQGISDVTDNTNYIIHAPVFINLWHGVPWKKIGIDAVKDSKGLKKAYASFLCRVREADYFLATSHKFEEVLKTSCCLNNSSILRAGYPRNSMFYEANECIKIRDEILSFLPKQVTNEKSKIIVYMPTFRDTKEQSFSFSSMEDSIRLQQILKDNNCIIIEKAHFAERNKNLAKNNSDRVFTLNDVSAQKLLASADMLITDYSSCFFDFLLLDRPIIHFLYDYDYYSNDDRGLYYSKEEVVCGDAVTTEEELLEAINNNINNPDLNKALRDKRREEFLEYESKDSCEQITEFIQEIMNKRR